MKTINIEGRPYPIHFGMAALSEFCDITDTPIKNLEFLGEDIKLGDSIKLVWCGLKHGARKELKKFTLTWEDIADFMDTDPEFINDAMNAFGDSMPEQGAKKKEMKKATD